jgi:hypothetical protein
MKKIKGLKSALKFSKSAEVIPPDDGRCENANSVADGDDSKRTKAGYKSQVRKLKAMFPNRKNKHSHRSKNKSPDSEEELEPESEPEPIRTKIKKKSRKKQSRKSQRSMSSEEEEEPAKAKRSKRKGLTSFFKGDDDGAEGGGSRTRSRTRTRNQIGLKYQTLATLLTATIVLSVAGLILIPIIEIVGSTWLWSTLAPAVVTIMVFLGLSSASALLSSAYIALFSLEEVKGRGLKGYILHGVVGVSVAVAFICLIIAICQFHDVMDIFGQRFLHLLRVSQYKL